MVTNQHGNFHQRFAAFLRALDSQTVLGSVVRRSSPLSLYISACKVLDPAIQNPRGSSKPLGLIDDGMTLIYDFYNPPLGLELGVYLVLCICIAPPQF